MHGPHPSSHFSLGPTIDGWDGIPRRPDNVSGKLYVTLREARVLSVSDLLEDSSKRPASSGSGAPGKGKLSVHSTHFVPQGMLSLTFVLLVITWLGIGIAQGADSSTGGKVDFNYDIRPIISGKCFKCHGPDEAGRKAHLRLDSRDEAMTPHDDVQAIVPGDLEKSELIARITSTDDDDVMPPPKEHKKLTESEVALLKKWIAQGAEYKPHWSFVKPERGEVPRIADCGLQTADWPQGVRPEDWSRNPIDAFVLQRMVKAGLKPSPQADPHALCRRLYLDLTGLPPTPQEVEDFTQSAIGNRQSAIESLVDHLLASPHFGEKWARMWLDLARYADSTGYGSDKFRLNIWPWRDWVIDAFNRNLPYDQFTIEQIAGDLLPNATTEQIAATAFNRNTMTNVEGGIVNEEYRVAAVKDRIATTAQTWMGLTMQCAQCHSHKFDPIAQKEYYSFFAIFNQTEDANREDEEPRMPVPTAEQKTETDRLNQEIAALEKKRDELTPAFEAELREWETKMKKTVDWTVLEPSDVSQVTAAAFTRKPDGSIFVGDSGEKTKYVVKTRTHLEGITAFRLELIPDAELPAGGAGHAENGNFVLNEFSVVATSPDAKAPRARYVRIEAPGKERILSLAEVQVFKGDANIAGKGKAFQSSTDFNGSANLAIDNNTDGEFERSHSVTHTKKSENPWWELDLGAETEIDRIVIWNRTDGGLGTRLANSRAIVLDGAHKELAELKLKEGPNPSVEFQPQEALLPIALHHASADFSQKDFPVENAIDGDSGKNSGWAVAPETSKPHAAVFETKQPVGNGDTLLTFRLEQNWGDNHVLGRFRISATTAPPPVRELPHEVKTILAIDESGRSAEQREQIASYFRPLSKFAAEIEKQMAAKRKELAAIKPVLLPVMREVSAKQRRETHLLSKGNYLTPAEKVEPGLPAAFSSWFKCKGTPDRLDVARWLVNSENPLTARVAVNRFWAQLFGTGIVETEEDFGTQGALPSHPQLLDWLAVTFESQKNSDPAQLGLAWDMKALVKLIVTSATYGQSSRTSAEDLEKDARDRWLERYPRHRLEAESVRDQALALSGLLAPKIGGPSVYPPQPPGLWRVAFNGGQDGYPTSKGEDRYRRGLYTFWRRTQPYPAMSTFDAPSRESCTLRRLPTNTPLQAFVTLNDPCFVECSQALARRIAHEGGADTASRLRWALQLVLVRPSAESQVTALRELFEKELANYKADPAAAAKLAASDTQPLPKDADAAELAAWTVVANVLLNLDGVLTKG